MIDEKLGLNIKKTLKKEYPEIFELSKRLKKEKLTKVDEWNLAEISEATGWDSDDIVNDLINLDANPSIRPMNYKNLFDKYYHEANELKDKDNLQAAEKLWGAITALVKLYAVRKGVFVSHWSREKLNRFVENNVDDARKRNLFYDLLTYGGELHEHFYENHLPPRKFDIRWKQCFELIERLKEAEID